MLGQLLDVKSPTIFGPYCLGKTIGQGEFGKVKVAHHLNTKQQVAIKFIKKSSVDTPGRKTKLTREISILQSLDHTYVVELFEVIETERYYGMVLEFASGTWPDPTSLGGELFEYILARDHLSEKESCRIFAQIIEAVSYIHSVGVIHRDLKLENILIDEDRNVKLTDFGFANSKEEMDGMFMTSCGSPCYAAPELVSDDVYVGELADIWSCGVILYAMVCGTLPFDDDPTNPESANMVQLYKYIMNTKLTFPVLLSSNCVNLLDKILLTDPTKRARLEDIKNDPYSHALTSSWMRTYQRAFKKYAPKPKVVISKVVVSEPILIPARKPATDLDEVRVLASESPIFSNPEALEGLSDKPGQTDSPIAPNLIRSLFPDLRSDSQVEDEEVAATELVTSPLVALSLVQEPEQIVNAAVHLSQTPISADIPVTCLDMIMEDQDLASVPHSRLFHSSSRTSLASTKSRLQRKSIQSFIMVEKPSLSEPLATITLDDLLEGNVSVISGGHRKGSILSDSSSSVDSDSSDVTIKRVRFPEVDEAAEAMDLVSELRPTRNIQQPRGSLNMLSRLNEPSYGKPQAKSLDIRRPNLLYPRKIPIDKFVSPHSGPIDQRALSSLKPSLLLEKLTFVLAEMGLAFTFSNDPYKLVVVKSLLADEESEVGSSDGKSSRVSRSTVSSTPMTIKKKSNSIGLSVSSFFQKLRYISLFGLQYNRGYDGSSAIAPLPNQNRPKSDSFVKFHVVVHRIRNLNGLYIIDLKRYKGDIWEFKRLYHQIILGLRLKE